MGYRLAGFQIGRNVFIGMHVYMDDMHPQRTVIEDDVTISYRVTFACHGPRSSNTKLVLRKGSYVGCNAILLGGFSRGDTEIGPYASVGAGALVNRSVPWQPSSANPRASSAPRVCLGALTSSLWMKLRKNIARHK